MSTRGAIGFKINGIYKITYNHSDSYPEGLGKEIVDFVNMIVSKNKISQLKENASKVRLVKEDSKPTPDEIEKYKYLYDGGVGEQTPEDWYCLLHSSQGIDGLKLIFDGKLDVMINSFDFLKDSLFCEYAYIINLDTQEIEFYEGFNKHFCRNSPLPFTRKEIKSEFAAFKFEQIQSNRSGCDTLYYPVRFKGSYKLDKIPSNWRKEIYGKK